MEKFAERLVEVIKAQRRADFGGTQFKSQRNGPDINVVERSLDLSQLMSLQKPGHQTQAQIPKGQQGLVQPVL